MRVIAVIVLLALAGCQTAGYQQYADAMARIAEAQASVERERTQMMMRLAEFATDPTTRTVAVVMLGIGGAGGSGKAYAMPQPPPNEPLEWARILIPSLVPVTLGLWNYKNTKDASQNAATTAQASYAAIFGVAKEGFAAAGSNVTTTVTETNTSTTTNTNQIGGSGAIGGSAVFNPPPVIPVVTVP